MGVGSGGVWSRDRAQRLRLSGQAVVMTITPRASGVFDNYPAGQLGYAHL